MVDLWQTLGQLVVVLGTLLAELVQFAASGLLLIVWVVWWLFGVNWKKAWPALALGGWAPVVLLSLVSALAWSEIAPSACACLGFVTIGNFWWQLGYVAMLVAIALLCGWLQGIFRWEPAELNLEPPAPAAHGHGHEPAHGHH